MNEFSKIKAREKFLYNTTMYNSYLSFHPEMEELNKVIQIIQQANKNNIPMQSVISVGQRCKSGFRYNLTGSYNQMRVLISEYDFMPCLLFKTNNYNIFSLFVDHILDYEINYETINDVTKRITMYIVLDKLEYKMVINIG